MKKIFFLMLILILGIALIRGIPANAIGPIFAGPSIVRWDPIPAGLSIYLYWRTSGNSSWDDSKRTAKITGDSFDLMTLGLPAGNYELCATAVNTEGSESGPSNVVPFLLSVPASPANLKLTLPNR